MQNRALTGGFVDNNSIHSFAASPSAPPSITPSQSISRSGTPHSQKLAASDQRRDQRTRKISSRDHNEAQLPPSKPRKWTKRSKRTLTTLPTIYEEDEPNEPAPARPKIPDYHPPSTPSCSSYQPPSIEDWDEEPTLQVPAAQEVCIPQTLTPRRPHYQTYNASAANGGPEVRARMISSQQRSPRPIQAHAGQRHKAKPPAKGALPPLSVPILPSYTLHASPQSTWIGKKLGTHLLLDSSSSEIIAKLPDWLKDMYVAFLPEEANKLPPRRLWDHAIDIKPGHEPPYEKNRPLSLKELLVVRKWLDDNLGKGFICESRSRSAAPLLLAAKPGGGVRICQDYRGLNNVTIKNRYPLPLIRETLDALCDAKVYTKLDIIAAFNKLRIAEGHEWKTAFITRFSLYESLVMLFGLCNALALF
ncbi:hypothetical protein P3342_004473 [Pyrenophora teres f. teres]|nr:hypothetical protein P3342_004473 [Pyrenophora teres f. teres]